MGDPNATATPAALAAVSISRIFPVHAVNRALQHKYGFTLTAGESTEHPSHHIADTASDVNRGTFFANGES